MGTWGAGGFDNDEALDWVAGVVSTEDLAAVLLGLPEDPVQEIDAEHAQRIIAAAECVAATMGRPAGALPDGLRGKLATLGEAQPPLIEAARQALSRVLGGSELVDAWDEQDAAAFNLAMTSLIDRLNPDLPFQPPPGAEATAVRQACAFCNRDIEPQALFAIEVRQHSDPVTALDIGMWCHLACLNARLHPRHLVQHWTFDPDVIAREAARLLED